MTPGIRGRMSSALSCTRGNPNAGRFLEFLPVNLSLLHEKLAEPCEKQPEGLGQILFREENAYARIT